MRRASQIETLKRALQVTKLTGKRAAYLSVVQRQVCKLA